jgi:transposase
MLHAGLDLSRKRLDVCLLSEEGEQLDQLAAPPDADGLRGLVRQVSSYRESVHAVIESMTGARFVHDTLEAEGWEVEIADAHKVKGLAPLACKTDRIDSQVLATLSHRDLVPAIWLPDPRVRRERELARFRLHLVKHRSQLKHRIHSALMTFGKPCPVTDLFGVEGRALLDRLEIPEPWRGNIDASIALIDSLERQVDDINKQLHEGGAEHPYVPLLLTVPGIGWVLAFTIAAEIGEIERFQARRSSRATPAFARASTSRARRTAAARSPSTDLATCAGRCSRRRCTRFATPPTRSATSAPSAGSASSAARRSPRSTSPAS